MSLTRFAILLFLGVVVTPFYADAQNFCQLYSSSISTSTNNNYTLTVSPSTLTNATVYTVTLTSTVNTTAGVQLQALVNGAAVGNWSVVNTNTTCNTNGVGDSYTLSTANKVTANWTSPSALSLNSSVIINAFVNDTGSVYKYNTTLSTVSNTANGTGSTASTTSTTTTTTTTATTKVGSGSHANNPTSLVLALCLLVITSKIFS